MWNYPDIRLLTLHRMQEVQILDKPVNVPDGFNLDDYISSGELNFVVKGNIQFKALFSTDAVFHLGERPLSDDQTISKQADGSMLVTATVLDTSELHWWLLGFGDQVEVLEPENIRNKIINILKSTVELYAEK
jgi:predicted DNA-binding transcriptional regulator YafY